MIITLNHKIYLCTFGVSEPKVPDPESLVPNEQLTEEDVQKAQMAQRRLSAYRALIFWTYPDIKRADHRPLPSCVHGLVRDMFPPTADEVIADIDLTSFIPKAQDDAQ